VPYILNVGNPDIEALKAFDTCILIDALETFDLRLRNQGYTRPGLRQMTGPPSIVIGYAVTARMRSSDPPILGNSFVAKNDWWPEIALSPKPRVAVIQDVDPQVGMGASIGQMSGSLFQALACSAVVTNGAVRDLGAIEEMKLPVFASHVSPSRSYAHIVDHCQPVEICGLIIRSGDLIAADRHGVILIPPELASKLPAVASDLLNRRRHFVDFCRSREFSLDRLPSEVQQLKP
jgi:4-hydroxy-4-methyl-2-oxoglutarate aldolase